MPINGIGFTEGLKGKSLLVIGAKSKMLYDKDGHSTGKAEAVRMITRSPDFGEITVDLYPFDEEKLEKCTDLFGTRFTIDDLVGLSDFKAYVFNGQLRVVLNAADIKAEPTIEM